MDFELNHEQKMWREAVHAFAEIEVKSRAKETDEKAQFNWEAVHKMGPIGLLGLNVRVWIPSAPRSRWRNWVGPVGPPLWPLPPTMAWDVLLSPFMALMN